MTHLHITVPAITRGSVARPDELENERRLGSSQSTNVFARALQSECLEQTKFSSECLRIFWQLVVVCATLKNTDVTDKK